MGVVTHISALYFIVIENIYFEVTMISKLKTSLFSLGFVLVGALSSTNTFAQSTIACDLVVDTIRVIPSESTGRLTVQILGGDLPELTAVRSFSDRQLDTAWKSSATSIFMESHTTQTPIRVHISFTDGTVPRNCRDDDEFHTIHRIEVSF